MAIERVVTRAQVLADSAGQIASGLLATEAKQDAMIAAAGKVHKGIVVPQVDVTVTDAVGTWGAAIVIPADVVAVRMFLDVAMYCVVNATATRNVGDNGGAPVAADRLVDIPCVGCTYLHVATAGGGNVTMKHSLVYGA